jgi:hypothetical protein
VSWRKDFFGIDQRFDGYFTSVVCLAMVSAIKENISSVPDDVCDIVAAMVTGIEKSNKMSVVKKSDTFLLKKATYLLRLSWQSSCRPVDFNFTDSGTRLHAKSAEDQTKSNSG